MSKRVSLVHIAEEQLFELIRRLPEGTRKLPSEEELCGQLDVSRATLREALGQLARSGFITKRHGVGNLVNFSVLNTSMRFDEELSMRRLLASAGKTSTQRFEPVPETEDLVTFIDAVTPCRIEIMHPWLIQESRHVINDKPAVWTFNIYPNTVRQLTEKDIQGLSYRELVNALTGTELSHTIKAVLPTSAEHRLAKAFGLNEGAPLIMWYLRNFGLDDELLNCGITIFNPEVVTLNSFNRWD